MEKVGFLTKVAEVMKSLISYENMMASIQRSCMRGEAANLKLMSDEEEQVDGIIAGMTSAEELKVSEDLTDVLVLRYLKNTQFLAKIKEDDIDITDLADDLDCWKKTMLFNADNGRTGT